MVENNGKGVFMILGVVLLCVSFFLIFLGLFTPMSFAISVFSGLVLLSISMVLIFLSKTHSSQGNKRAGIETRIRELESLRADELISEEEYEIKRTQIMKEEW